MKEFKNESYIDFSNPENRSKMEDVIKKAESQLGKEYPIIIGGENITLETKFKSFNPAEKEQAIGIFQKADKDTGEKAMKKALEVFEEWKSVEPSERAGYLFKAAEIMRSRRLEIDAWEILEEGKGWIEADADVAEAIDFLEFYGLEMLRYGGEQPVVQIPGEKEELFYIPLGVGIVIPPWNFPMAILCGMTSAALVTGNTVILKPSSDAPKIGHLFMEILEEAGLPKGVVNYVTGSGSVVGDYLVQHPKTRFIAFTGSKEVGLRIVEQAAITREGQIWIKRVIAEMGGKDAIIIDNESNLESAVDGVLYSAFGFQGQKCSACSRAIVVTEVYDEFLNKLVEKTKKLTVGPTKLYDNFMGAVINEKAYNSMLSYIEKGKEEGGKLLTGGEPAEGNGYFIKPTIIADVKPGDTIEQEEIFGPVLAVIKAKDYDEAITVANDTNYGLTGAVYTLNREKIEKAKKLFHCGNLYFNRKCTGALVGAQPFGGFNMSGTNSKAGGRDYLLLFLQAKSVAKKIV
ncbi:MAG: L-glutamate gamma-semialdehyde dehydrogenase [Candidatus Cloacimonadota bacterium]|nr:MAG: L-glutamate gamma-semialdehyde dehydrogenase [Candidatus Cloacimonadota bacterium]